MTVKRLGHSIVLYGNRLGDGRYRPGSNIDARTVFSGSEKERTGYIELAIHVGDRRGHVINLALDRQDFRKVLDLRVEADATMALREMSAVVTKALAEG